MNIGNATALYICPTCGCPDLMTAQSALALPAKERRTVCPNCKWEGMLSDAAGIATTEKVYDTKAILNLLLFVVSKHAAGPISQALQFVGLIDKDDQEGLDKVMRAATSGMIEQAFMAAAEHAAEKATKQVPQLHTLADCPACRGTCVAGNEGCPLCRATGKQIGRFPIEVQLALVDQKVAALKTETENIPEGT